MRFIFSAVILSFCVSALASSFFLDGPHVNEGRLFVLELRPKDKAIEVKVAGKSAVEVQWEKLELKVEGKYGSEKKYIPVVKTNNIFLLKPENTDPSALYFQMSMGNQTETITIEKP